MALDLPYDLSQLPWFNWVGSAMYWIQIVLLAAVILGGIWFAYYYFSFKYDLTVFPLKGGVQGYAIDKPKKNRLRWTKRRTSWQPMWPLFTGRRLEPFDDKYVYPGNKVFAYELNGELIPANIATLTGEGEKVISPVPHYIRNWQSIERKRNEMEFAQHNFWADNKGLIFTLLAVVACCILCGVTVYITYQFAAGGTASMDRLSAAIQNWGTIK